LGSPMPKGLQRYYGRGHLHFLTFSCYRRLPLLKTVHARDAFVRELARVRAQYGFLLVGYVVMPEHVHLLISEPRRGTPSTVLQMLKQRVSKKLGKNVKLAPRARFELATLRLTADQPTSSKLAGVGPNRRK
jgi:REP element-mobilizing transposase RayT